MKKLNNYFSVFINFRVQYKREVLFMRKIMALMAIFMGLIMSFILSLVGTLVGGHFSIPAWMMSFGISLVLSIIIGFVVPVKMLGDKFCKKHNVIPESPKGNFMSALISNLIYTPFLTIVMVSTMVLMATKEIPVWQPRLNILLHALVPSLIISFIVGYIAITIFQPLLVRMLIKKIKQPETTQENE